MAKTEKRARDNIKPSSYFLRCFGFSRKIYSEKPMVEDGDEKKKMKKKKSSKKRISRWFTSSKNGKTKQSPIEETEKLTSTVEDQTDKQKRLSLIRRLSDRKSIPVVDKKPVVNHEIKETKLKDLRDTVTDRAKPIERLASIKEDTCQDQKSNSTGKDKPDVKPSRRTGSRDPVIGISIIVLTLIVMLLCGRLCAILCTSTWCYFQPRLINAAALAKRQRSVGDGSASVPDLNSESYKKKVILDGFLGRQNRVSQT